ncbi:hypothetical protein [Amycolatopsis minnesotensis]|uniref:Uncharacterized protein n=1 Tax=Amycolatopsis minnesotensis TaxID=337894 RepID=A0ABP5E757_9PSEU
MPTGTDDLLRALGAVQRRLPEVMLALAYGGVAADKQHEFASRVCEVGELLHQHADRHTAEDIRWALLEVELPEVRSAFDDAERDRS